VGFLSSIFSKPVRRVELEDLIYEIAEHQRDGDFQALYREMRHREVFVPIVAASLPAGSQPGQVITTSATSQIRMRTVSGPKGTQLVPCATRQDSELLKDGYVGMPWRGFLEMVLKTDPGLHGALLQGSRSWIAFDRQRVRHVLSVTAA